MIAEIWTITYQPDLSEPETRTRTAKRWGVKSVVRRLTNQGTDTISIVMDGADIDSAAPWAYGQSVLIRRAGVRWFLGRVTTIPRQGTAQGESMRYELSGPWWYLENCFFEQAWKERLSEEDPTLVDVLKTRAVLGQDVNGSRITNGQQIAAIIAMAVSRGAPLAVGNIDPDTIIPFDESKDVTCAEAIRKMMRWNPNATTWIDYSTEPHPTLHVTTRANMPTESLTVGNRADAIAEVDIMPRHDLRPPAVVIKIERENDFDGDVFTSTEVLKAPPEASGTEFGTLLLTMEMGGASNSMERQVVEAESIDEDDPNWWKRKEANLKGIGSDFEIIPGTSSVIGLNDEAALPRELTGGAAPSWITTQQTYPVIVSASFKGTAVDGTIHKATPLKIQVMGTELSSKTYARMSSATFAEEVPTGLASQLFASLNVLHYEGSITTIERECTGRLRPGKLLNILSGHSEWASMQAQIQEVVEDVGSGTTTVSFGPPSHLTPQDLVELAMVGRRRVVAISAGGRSSGQSTRAPIVEGARKTAIHRGAVIGSVITKDELTGDGENAGSKITRDVSTPSGGGSVEPTFAIEHKDGAKSETKSTSTSAKLRLVNSSGNNEVIVEAGSADGELRIKLDDATITLNMLDLLETSAPSDVDIRLREVPYCNPDDTETPHKIIIMASEPYAAGGGE